MLEYGSLKGFIVQIAEFNQKNVDNFEKMKMIQDKVRRHEATHRAMLEQDTCNGVHMKDHCVRVQNKQGEIKEYKIDLEKNRMNAGNIKIMQNKENILDLFKDLDVVEHKHVVKERPNTNQFLQHKIK